MPKVRIKRIEDRVATSGLHLTNDPQEKKVMRKIEPGEIVDIPDDLKVSGDKHNRSLLDILWATEKLELVPPSTPVTRPLTYETPKEAEVCSPSYVPRDESAKKEMNEMRRVVAARLLIADKDARQAEEDDKDDLDDPVDSQTAQLASSRKRRTNNIASG